MYENTGAARAPDGRRADRSGRRRRRASTAASTRTCRRASSRCSALALGQLQRFDDGELAIATLSAEDFDRADAEESYSEGIIDQLRALQGTKVAVLVREITSGERKGQHKVSLRATDDDVDVSIIARAQGGGGHRRAAGFSTTLEPEELIAFLREAIAAQLHPPPTGTPPRRSPEGAGPAAG